METVILTTEEINYLIKKAKSEKIDKIILLIILGGIGICWFWLITNRFTNFLNLLCDGEPFMFFFNLVVFGGTFIFPLFNLFFTKNKANIIKNGFYKAYLVDVLDKRKKIRNTENNSYNYYVTVSFGGDKKEILTDERNYFFLGKNLKALLIQYNDEDFEIYNRNLLKNLSKEKKE